jgi:hypothetical protein
MKCGATYARVQLFRHSHMHFNYVTVASAMTYGIHDCQTLEPLVHSRQRIQLARPAEDLVQWIRSQGLQVLLTTASLEVDRLNGEPNLAPWLYVVAVFVPCDESSSTAHSLQNLWNSYYMAKCLDNSALDCWTARTQQAIAMGATRVSLCTLYNGSDYTTELSHEYCLVAKPPMRHHLSMQPLAKQASVVALHTRFHLLVGWTRQIGYRWLLCASDEPVPRWAYFTLLLDPLDGYKTIPK